MAQSIAARGWRFNAHGGTFKKVLRLEEFQVTRGNGALVRMQAAPVTQLDLDRVRGFCGWLPLPALFGSSGVGAVAQGAGALKEGDRVLLSSANLAGSLATQVAVAPGHLIKIPDSIPLELAANLAVGPFAAWQFMKATGLKSGDVLALNGENSLLGKSVALLAKARGVTVVCGAAAAKATPKFALSLLGGTDAALLADTLVNGGQLVLHICPSDEAPLLEGAQLADKNITVRTLSPAATSDAEVQQMVEEVADLLKGGTLGAKLIRYDFAKFLDAVEEVSAGAEGAHWVAVA